MTDQLPQNLQAAIIHFANPNHALEFVVNMRWPNGVECPRCESREVSFLKTRRMWKCLECKKQFSVKVGSIFEDSPIGLDKWLCAMWIIANARNGVSSHEIGRSIGVTQKTAWFLLHRIRLAMQAGTLEKKLLGDVEVDETYIGGKARNMHESKRNKLQGRGGVGKTVVMGLLERHGEVRTMVIKNTKAATLWPLVGTNVENGANVFTDENPSYEGLDDYYTHQVINHAEEYVRGDVHTNSIENYWSLLKRTLKGTYVSVEPFHLFRYLDEQSFRFNKRTMTDAERFEIAVKSIFGKRLTYDKLTGNAPLKQLELPL